MVATSALVGLIAATVLSVAAPMVAFLVCWRRMMLSWRNVLLGAVVFIVASLVLGRALTTYLMLQNADTHAWFAGHRIAYILYGILAAGIWEEGGRYLALRFAAKRVGTPGTAVSYGIGHGGAEALLIGALASVQTFALATMLNAGTLDSALAGTPPEVIAHMKDTLAHLTMLTALVGGLERCVAFLIQIVLSLVVWRAVERRRPWLLLAAIGIHAAFDVPAALYQAHVAGLLPTESAYMALGAALLWWLVARLPPRTATHPVGA
jgi:uncharacterized membrane protein YhfC